MSAALPHRRDSIQPGCVPYLPGRPVRNTRDRGQASRHYAAWVNDTRADERTIWQIDLHLQVTRSFRMQAMASGLQRASIAFRAVSRERDDDARFWQDGLRGQIYLGVLAT